MSVHLRESLVVRARREGGQKNLAEKLGCTQPTVSRLITGELALSIPLARAIVTAYPELRRLVEETLLDCSVDRTATAEVA